MKNLLTTASFIAALAVGPVLAQQQGNPAGMTPGTQQSAPGMLAPNQPNVADRNFARAAAAGGLSEVELGQLAEHEGQSSAVREFGQRMVSDHSKANAQLKELAAAASIPLPNTPDAEHRTMREQLDQAHGAAFDRPYIRGQVIDHQQTAQLLEYEIGSGQDAQLKDFASQVLPIVMQHLEMAQNIDAYLAGAAAPEAAMPSAAREMSAPGAQQQPQGANRAGGHGGQTQ
jgi:putative membrane protein